MTTSAQQSRALSILARFDIHPGIGGAFGGLLALYGDDELATAHWKATQPEAR